MEKTAEFTIQDVQNILKTSERLNKYKDEIKRFLRIIEGFLEESGELNKYLLQQKLSPGSQITQVYFKEPFNDYSCAIYYGTYLHISKRSNLSFSLRHMNVRLTSNDVFADNVDGLSRHLVPIFYLALPEILEALVALFPKLGGNIQELIQISNMTQ